MSKFLVWMEVDSIERAVGETGVGDFTSVHEYLRLLYEACARQFLSPEITVRVRQRALVKLAVTADQIAEHRGWWQGMWHKMKARCMAPEGEVLPWGFRAALQWVS